MEKELNGLLADLVVEYHKLQNLHWYVEGKDFFTTHTKLEEFYNYINAMIDEVAEHILMIDGQPKASLKEFLEASNIEELPEKHISSSEAFSHVKTDFTYLLENIRKIKKEADQKEIYVISSLMDGYISNFTKTLWMLKQL